MKLKTLLTHGYHFSINLRVSEMFDKSYISKDVEIFKKYIAENYKIDTNKLPYIDTFIEDAILSVMTIKIWQDVLSKDKTILPCLPFLSEIASNIIQYMIVSLIGLKSSSYFLIRRSQENIYKFLFYKDHPIEFNKKENESDTLKSVKISELEKYFKDFPFEIYYKNIDHDKLIKQVEKVCGLWKEDYQYISNYVHATTSTHLDLKLYLEQINSNDKLLEELNKKNINLRSVINSLLISYFFNEFKNMDKVPKSIIRYSISDDLFIKKAFIDIFGEL